MEQEQGGKSSDPCKMKNKIQDGWPEEGDSGGLFSNTSKILANTFRYREFLYDMKGRVKNDGHKLWET